MTPVWIIALLAFAGMVLVVLPLHIAMSGVCLLLLAAVLLVLRWLEKQEKKQPWKRILITLTAVGAAVILGLTGFVILEGRNTALPEPHPDFVIVLGAQTYGESPSRTLRQRLELAKDYLEENPEAVCVVSGGQGDDEAMPEAQVMAKWLQKNGIDEDRILLEENSHTTRENLIYSKEIAEDHGINTRSVLIITSEFHLLRAKYIAEHLGMTAYGMGSTTTPWILMVNYALREVFSMVKAAYQTWRA